MMRRNMKTRMIRSRLSRALRFTELSEEEVWVMGDVDEEGI